MTWKEEKKKSNRTTRSILKNWNVFCVSEEMTAIWEGHQRGWTSSSPAHSMYSQYQVQVPTSILVKYQNFRSGNVLAPYKFFKILVTGPLMETHVKLPWTYANGNLSLADNEQLRWRSHLQHWQTKVQFPQKTTWQKLKSTSLSEQRDAPSQ